MNRASIDDVSVRPRQRESTPDEAHSPRVHLLIATPSRRKRHPFLSGGTHPNFQNSKCNNGNPLFRMVYNSRENAADILSTLRIPRAAYCTAGSCCLHLGSSNGVMPASACFCMGPQYTQVKLKLGITEKDACGDCCCVCLCHSCAQCRVVRELKARGIYTEEQMNGQLPSTLAPSNMTMIKDR